MGSNVVPQPSTVPARQSAGWRGRIASMGPGLIAASAAIGASHLVSSTQAGALYGWQLAVLIIAANVLKYPFFRFGPQYTAESGHSLVEGYARKGKPYLIAFFILCTLSSVISSAAVSLLASVILVNVLPASWGISVSAAAATIFVVSWLILIGGHYRALDGITKVVVVTLAISTVVAVILAAAQAPGGQPQVEVASPWSMATLAFLVALVGWMPAPIEVSALNSMWIKAKQQQRQLSTREILFDFNVGYVMLSALAVVFLALGVFVQYGSGEELQMEGGAYVPQLMAMYGAAIGQWAVPFMGWIAFFTMASTVLAVVDGYSRVCAESVRLLRGKGEMTRRAKDLWITGISAVALVIVTQMSDNLADMLRFAMTTAFIAAPVYAWLNFALVRRERNLSVGLRVLSYVGLAFLIGFAGLYLTHLFGFIG